MPTKDLMLEVPISEKLLRSLWADYAWFQKDPVALQSLRLEQLCTRIEALLEEYRTKRNIPRSADPYDTYQ